MTLVPANTLMALASATFCSFVFNYFCSLSSPGDSFLSPPSAFCSKDLKHPHPGSISWHSFPNPCDPKQFDRSGRPNRFCHQLAGLSRVRVHRKEGSALMGATWLSDPVKCMPQWAAEPEDSILSNSHSQGPAVHPGCECSPPGARCHKGRAGLPGGADFLPPCSKPNTASHGHCTTRFTTGRHGPTATPCIM